MTQELRKRAEELAGLVDERGDYTIARAERVEGILALYDEGRKAALEEVAQMIPGWENRIRALAGKEGATTPTFLPPCCAQVGCTKMEPHQHQIEGPSAARRIGDQGEE